VGVPWDLIGTWAAILLTLIGGVYALGKQAQKIDDQQKQIDELKESVKDSQEFPIKLAAFETDIKYLIRELTDIKQFLMSGKVK